MLFVKNKIIKSLKAGFKITPETKVTIIQAFLTLSQSSCLQLLPFLNRYN